MHGKLPDQDPEDLAKRGKKPPGSTGSEIAESIQDSKITGDLAHHETTKRNVEIESKYEPVTTKGTGKTRAEYLREKYGKLSSEQLHANINARSGISFPQRTPNSKLKQGGYSTSDVGAYKKLSPSKNRASGYGTSKSDGLVQAHHAIQDEWAKLWAKRKGIKYRSSNAPSILLKSTSGESHAIISALQRARRRTEGFNTNIVYEFNESFREMIKAGVDPKVAKKVIQEAYKFFDGLGGFK
nr:hypothetical protein [Paenibacillus tengchongensis]